MNTQLNNTEAQQNAVVVSAITLTNPTQKAKGMKEGDYDKLMKSVSDDEKKQLTVKVEFQQQAESRPTNQISTGRRGSIFSIEDTMGGHDAIITGPRYKRVWVNMTIANLEKYGFFLGVDISTKLDCVCYLLREDTYEPEVRDGKIPSTSAPKRKGKGGDVILHNEKFVFQMTTLVTSKKVFSGFYAEFSNFTYDQFVQAEQAAAILGNGTIPAVDVPEETKANGFFTDEYAKWLHNEYAKRSAKLLTEVA